MLEDGVCMCVCVRETERKRENYENECVKVVKES